MLLLWTVALLITHLRLYYSGAAVVDDHVFTINQITLHASPLNEVQRGTAVNLTCTMDISQSSAFAIQSEYCFDKEGSLVYCVTSESRRVVYSIDPVQVSHSGYYQCKVNASSMQKSSNEVPLTVTGLAEPTITVSTKEAKEGDSVEVRCEVPDEKPPISFSFIKTNKIQKKEVVFRKALHKNYAVATFQVAEGDAFLRFGCNASIEVMSKPEISELRNQTLVSVAVPFRTPAITVWPSSNITEGKNLTVECKVHTSHTNPEATRLIMQKDKQIMLSSKEEKIVFNVIATLAHMGNYTCKAESSKVSKTSSMYISVSELFPRPRLVASAMDISEGGDLSLSCFITGQNQTALNFFIEKDRALRKPMKQYGKFSKKAEEKDSGSYVCGVTMQNITKISSLVKILVYAAVSRPVLTRDSPGSDVVVGQAFRLRCKSLRGTPPIQYALFRGTDNLGRINVTGNASAVFEVHASRSHHSGEYRCEAKNKNKAPWIESLPINITAIAPVQETVLSIIPPTGEVEDGHELSLLCRVTSGSLPITFTFYHTDKSNKSSTLNVTTVPKHYASWINYDFKKSKEGIYFCTASNKAKITKASSLVPVKVVLQSWKKAIIALSVVTISIAVAAGLIWWYLQRKKKSKQLSLEMARTKNSNNAKVSTGQNTAEDPYYANNENGENHIEKPTEEKKGPGETINDVEYVEVMQDAPDSHKAPVTKGTDTVYSEIRQAQQGENRRLA
ncbi:platelet endothelial cell adhesion molecule isoform X2 [Pleurodeles waltl]|uniref:platelet endothelial cell adhesion molecule isoform X2 n=1 Tax=Pleurodeles waltl TaxID=8319 RepID=UPI003709ABD8